LKLAVSFFAPFAARRFGLDQRLHLVAPGLPLARPADVAQIVQRAEDLGEPLQVVFVWRGPRPVSPVRTPGAAERRRSAMARARDSIAWICPRGVATARRLRVAPAVPPI